MILNSKLKPKVQGEVVVKLGPKRFVENRLSLRVLQTLAPHPITCDTFASTVSAQCVGTLPLTPHTTPGAQNLVCLTL